jgi:hypothetical protein
MSGFALGWIIEECIIDFQKYLGDRLPQGISGQTDIVIRSLPGGSGKFKSLFDDDLLGNFGRHWPKSPRFRSESALPCFLLE